MQTIETRFTREALSNHVTNNEGHLDVLTDKGTHILTLIHPVLKHDYPLNARVVEFKANLRLFQYAANTFESLEEITSTLRLLKEGKIDIFHFPIDELIKRGESALRKASQID